MKITLTQTDIEKAKIQNSPNGELIDELAYSAGEWTSEDLYSNNFEYEPSEPYQYNYEKDLFTHTRTAGELYALAQQLEVPMNANWERIAKEQGLQAGAYMALNYPEQWATLLSAYKDKLQEDRAEGISEQYNKKLQEEIDSYNNDQYKEWLYGDHRDYAGVIRMISKYYTEDSRAGEYTKYNPDTQAEASFTFEMDEQQLHNDYCGADLSDSASECEECKKHDFKADLLATIEHASNTRKAKDTATREARRAEFAKKKEYQAKRKLEDEAERRAELLAMTLNN